MTDIEPSLYQLLGGETGLRSLVNRFYDLMDSAPEAQNIRSLHAKSLKQSREKLFMFLSGWSGGPQLYIQRFGHPRLRMRHMPFTIDQTARDRWVANMDRALTAAGLPDDVAGLLREFFHSTATFMINR